MSIPGLSPLEVRLNGRTDSAGLACAAPSSVNTPAYLPPRDKPGGLGSLHHVSQEQRLALTLALTQGSLIADDNVGLCCRANNGYS